MAVQVHYRKNQYLAIIHHVDDAIKETMRPTAPDFRIQQLPGLGLLDDTLNGNPDFQNKIVTGAGNAIFVVTCRNLQLLPGRWQQPKFHPRNSDSMALMAASPSIAWSSPLR